MSVETYLLYLGVLAAFFVTPPDTSQLLIISNSLRHGLRRSLATVAGDLTANSIQMTLAAFGLTAIVAASADALWIVKWLGVAYLAWIGLKLIFSKAETDTPTPAGGRLFRQGFFTSMANPYAVVFFGALFPQFIDTGAPIWPQLLILGVTYLVVDGLILILWGWTARRTIGRVKALTGQWINRVSGALMLGAAVLLGLKDIDQTAR
ncbi:MAG: LysE family translocator [Pseudomonadota bacterium]